MWMPKVGLKVLWKLLTEGGGDRAWRRGTWVETSTRLWLHKSDGSGDAGARGHEKPAAASSQKPCDVLGKFDIILKILKSMKSLNQEVVFKVFHF